MGRLGRKCGMGGLGRKCDLGVGWDVVLVDGEEYGMGW